MFRFRLVVLFCLFNTDYCGAAVPRFSPVLDSIKNARCKVQSIGISLNRNDDQNSESSLYGRLRNNMRKGSTVVLPLAFAFRLNGSVMMRTKQRQLPPAANNAKDQIVFSPVRRNIIASGCNHPRHVTTRRSFSNSLNDSSNKEPDEENDENIKEKTDLPAWAQNLFKWPSRQSLSIYQDTTAPNSELQQNGEHQGVDRKNPSTHRTVLEAESLTPKQIPTPLANLFNVEALLASFPEPARNRGCKADSDGNSTPSNLKSRITGSTPSLNQSDSSQHLDISRLSTFIPRSEELGNWDKLVRTLKRSVKEAVYSPEEKNASESTGKITASSASPQVSKSYAVEQVLKQAASQIEFFLNDVSTAISSDKVKNLVLQASKTLAVYENAGNLKAALDKVVSAAEIMARDQGLNVRDAAARARITAIATADLVRVGNGLLVSGYVEEDRRRGRCVANEEPTSELTRSASTSKPLFHNFTSARAVSKADYAQSVTKAVEMSMLAAAIYQDTVPITHGLGHAIVANGTSANVAWMITDSIGYELEFSNMHDDETSNAPMLLRTITTRGFDASDKTVDREELLETICNATPVVVGDGSRGVKVHGGLWSVAKEVYNDILPYIDMIGPNNRIVLNGHSVGGSLSVLMMMMLVEDRGVEYAAKTLARVFTFGSPPVSLLDDGAKQAKKAEGTNGHCSILNAFGLPSSKVYGYVQPWDPIVRLFSSVDPLYPLVGNVGEDGVTIWENGPKRTLRPITRSILESWGGWPAARDTFRGTASQNFTTAGFQHLLLPEPTRYLMDRLVSVNVAVPPIDSVVIISSKELLPALQATFPLDVFSISFVAAALRSFVHHFYPAYGPPLVEYAKGKKERKRKAAAGRMKLGTENNTGKLEKLPLDNFERIGNESRFGIIPNKILVDAISVRSESNCSAATGWTEAMTKWVLG